MVCMSMQKAQPLIWEARMRTSSTRGPSRPASVAAWAAVVARRCMAEYVRAEWVLRSRRSLLRVVMGSDDRSLPGP